jgi:hypothetical protein
LDLFASDTRDTRPALENAINNTKWLVGGLNNESEYLEIKLSTLHSGN